MEIKQVIKQYKYINMFKLIIYYFIIISISIISKSFSSKIEYNLGIKYYLLSSSKNIVIATISPKFHFIS